jgi:hypothetical protein
MLPSDVGSQVYGGQTIRKPPGDNAFAALSVRETRF